MRVRPTLILLAALALGAAPSSLAAQTDVIRGRVTNSEGLPLGCLAEHPAFGREYHSQRNQEENDPAGDADGFLLEVQEPQQVIAKYEEDEQDDIRGEDLAHQDLPLALRAHFLQDREEHRDISQRVHDEKERRHRGQHIHRRIVVAAIR